MPLSRLYSKYGAKARSFVSLASILNNRDKQLCPKVTKFFKKKQHFFFLQLYFCMNWASYVNEWVLEVF